MTDTFVKLYGTILDSSVWGEPLAVRVVWIAMLTMADKHGVVAASNDGIARRANVPLKATEKALAVLEAPDPRSKSQEYDGRRIERFDGGWRILNYERYRDKRSDRQVRDAQRQQRHRDRGVTERDITPSHTVSRNVAPDGEADADTKADAETTSPSPARADLSAQTLATLRIPPEKLKSWRALLEGMTEGVGTSGMKPVSWEVLHEAATELATAGGDVTAHRYKAYVTKVIQRQHAPPVSGGKKSGQSRSAPHVPIWKRDEHDRGLNSQPEIQALVTEAREIKGAEWWNRMLTEAKAADRWVVPYAFETLQPEVAANG